MDGIQNMHHILLIEHWIWIWHVLTDGGNGNRLYGTFLCTRRDNACNYIIRRIKEKYKIERLFTLEVSTKGFTEKIKGYEIY